MIPTTTAPAYLIHRHYAFTFQSRNRETYDSNKPEFIRHRLISLFQSRNRETYDSN